MSAGEKNPITQRKGRKFFSGGENISGKSSAKGSKKTPAIEIARVIDGIIRQRSG
jgi:hypothetical protein